jgi:Na+-transporting methylmalonyl-CoA/oxaloacetate decarboxylase gamma subunit
MIENLYIAAQISALGMGLVFAAILLLWGVLALLVRLTTERQPEPDTNPAEITPALAILDAPNPRSARARAAAVAVAIALARKAPTPATHEMVSTTPSSAVSAWQAVMRATVLNARRPRR